MRTLFLALLALTFSPFHSSASSDPPVLVPAYNAYSSPDPFATHVGSGDLTGWDSSKTSIFWMVKIDMPGTLNAGLSLSLPKGDTSTIRLSVGQQHYEATATGDGSNPVEIHFGKVNIDAPGYVKFTLTGVSKSGKSFGHLHSLVLTGEDASGVKVVTPPAQRGAPSVHLFYQVPDNQHVVEFYTEAKGLTTPLDSFYMACGWQRGYFGMQVNSPTRRTILFSVWDSGDNKIDPNTTPLADQVHVVATGPKVKAERFGNEGTGSHCMLTYHWHKGETYRFLVTAKQGKSHTVYSGYFYMPETEQWQLIGSMSAPGNSTMYGLYSFDEDFWSSNGYLKRSADFSNQWVKFKNGGWHALTSAVFSDTGGKWRTDYNARPVQDGFILSGGGFKDGPVKYGDILTDKRSGELPYKVPSALGGWKPELFVKVDTSQAPDLQQWGEDAAALDKVWYPKIVKYLWTPGWLPPNHITISLQNMGGVAYTAGTTITVSAQYVRSNPKDIGLIVHELTHVVQNYPTYNASWLVEGIADYVRFWLYDLKTPRPVINPDTASYHDAYRTAASFLAWVTAHYDKKLVPHLNDALRAGTYSHATFKALTGVGLNALWKDFTDRIREGKAKEFVSN